MLLSGLMLSKAAVADDPNTLFDMSLEELMEIPVAVSGSRNEQKIVDLSVPVGIITAEDIHYSGLTSIPEILQFTPGVDVLPLSRVRYAVGVRGLHDLISDRTLTLINGRSADSPFFGGSEFYRYQILMEDIERIEIVRGPGGAAWGANAFTGVINIITKRPGEEPGWLISSTVNEYGDLYNHIRWSGRDHQWSWRASAGYEDFEDSDAAGAGRMFSSQPGLNPLIGFDSYTAQDFSKNLRLDTEFAYDYSDRTRVLFGAGYAHVQPGDWEFLGYYNGGKAWFETFRNFIKMEHAFDDQTNGYVQWSGNFSHSKQPSLLRWLTLENDLEAQWDKRSDSHHLTLGGNVRLTYIDTDPISPESLISEGGPFCETTAGLFIMDRYEATDRLSLEGQLRADVYSETHPDWSTRITALYALDPARENNLRFSFAKSYRSPYLSLRNTRTSRVYHPGLATYLYHTNNYKDLKNEETWTLEMGYSSQLTEHVFFQSNAYYQPFDRLIGFEGGPALPATFTADNINGADSWGIETEIALQNRWGKLSFWHAYNDFEGKQADQPIRSYLPAPHKVGLTGRLFLDHGFCLNMNYRYTDTTGILGENTIFPVEATHRLDLSLSKAFDHNRGEFMIGVTDLLNETRGPHYSVGTMTAYETPGRTFFARLQFRF